MKKDIQEIIDAFILAHKIEGIKDFSSAFYKKFSRDKLGSDTWILRQTNNRPWLIERSLTVLLTCENKIFIEIDTKYGHFKNYRISAIEDLFEFEVFEDKDKAEVLVDLDTLMEVLLILTR